MLYEIKALKQHLLAGRARELRWIDTRDMLADALAKGEVARDALLTALRTGARKIAHKDKVKVSPAVRPQVQLFYPARVVAKEEQGDNVEPWAL
eukprot:3280835-Pyramimonas_sp.AAC.1